MQRLSGTARDFFVVAAISTINVEVVLGEFVRCFHRPPGNSSPTRRSTVGGGGTRKPARDPIGYGREAMRWRRWSNWRQVSARSGGQSLKKYNRFDITDHHRSDMGPSDMERPVKRFGLSDMERPVKRFGLSSCHLRFGARHDSDDRAAPATVDHSDIRGSRPHGRHPSGAASD